VHARRAAVQRAAIVIPQLPDQFPACPAISGFAKVAEQRPRNPGGTMDSSGYESPTKGLQMVMQRLSSPSKAAAMNYIVVHQLQVSPGPDLRAQSRALRRVLVLVCAM